MLTRASRAVLAAALLVVLSVPSWPRQIDDTALDAAYAFELVEHGRLLWPGGGLAEGYSSFLFTLLLTVPAALGWDPGLFAQLAALASGVVLVVLVSTRLGTQPADHVLVAGVVLCPPLAWWSGMGTETTLAAVLLAVGWVSALTASGSRTLAIVALVAASLLRPELLVHALAAGAWLAWRRQGVGAVLNGGRVLLAYHVWRVWTYGAFLPDSLTAGRGEGHGLAQVALEGALVAPLVLVWALHFRARRPWWLLPLAGHLALLLALGGDPLGHGRLVLPGLAASLAMLLATGEVRQSRWLLPAAMATAGASLAVVGQSAVAWRECPTRAGLRVAAMMDLQTPGLADLVSVVWGAPAGAEVSAREVGMLGHVAGVRVRIPAWRSEGGQPRFGEASWGPDPAGEPRAGLVVERLEQLVTRFPAQPALRVELAAAQAAALLGDRAVVGGALEVLGGVAGVDERRVELYSNGAVRLGPVDQPLTAAWVLGANVSTVAWSRCGEREDRVEVGPTPVVGPACTLAEGEAFEVSFRDDLDTFFVDRNLVVWGARVGG